MTGMPADPPDQDGGGGAVRVGFKGRGGGEKQAARVFEAVRQSPHT